MWDVIDNSHILIRNDANTIHLTISHLIDFLQGIKMHGFILRSKAKSRLIVEKGYDLHRIPVASIPICLVYPFTCNKVNS